MAKKDFMNLMKAKTTDLKPSLLSAEEHIKSQVLVIDQLRELIPPLSNEELTQLEQNIVKYGIKDPLSIWETTSQIAGIDDEDTPVFVLIDGHNRYRISQMHKIDFRISIMQFPSLNEVKDYMINYQLGRRNLTPEQTSYLRGMRYLQQKSIRGSNLRSEEPQVNVADTLASEYHVSSRTIKRDAEFAAGIEKLTPDLKKDILSGKQKLTKSTVKAIAKTNITKPIGFVDTISVTSQSFGENSKKEKVNPSENLIETLQHEIRKIANGSLNRRSCSQLIKKTTELLSLQSSK